MTGSSGLPAGRQRSSAMAGRLLRWGRMDCRGLDSVWSTGVWPGTASASLRASTSRLARCWARQAAEDVIAKAAAELGEPSTSAGTVRAACGVPGETLIEASADADLLGVGSRGMSGFRWLLLGSVSSEVLHYALPGGRDPRRQVTQAVRPVIRGE